MAASYTTLQEFVGGGVLQHSVKRLEEDGWDDVQTLQMMSASDMDALQLTEAQRDALELRTYLHDRDLMQYADRLESLNKSLPELLNADPTELTIQYGMKRGHVARFMDRSNGCGVPPTPKRRSLGVLDVNPFSSINSHQRRSASHDRLSIDSSRSVTRGQQNGYDQTSESVSGGAPTRLDEEEVSYFSAPARVAPSPPPAAAVTAPLPMKGIVRQHAVGPRCCGLVRTAPEREDLTSLSVLEKIYIQRLTPEYKQGMDPWDGGELKLPPPIKVAELWASKPTLLLCLRRPGCVMCRAEAHQLYARKPVFDALGVRLVAVLNEYVDAEVKAFWPRFWGGMVVVDRNRDLFKSFGGGKLLKDDLIVGFILNARAKRNWKRATATGVTYNFRGEGRIKGGTYIIGQGKTGVAYQFVERTFGDTAPLEEVLDVCTKLQQTLTAD